MNRLQIFFGSINITYLIILKRNDQSSHKPPSQIHLLLLTPLLAVQLSLILLNSHWLHITNFNSIKTLVPPEVVIA